MKTVATPDLSCCFLCHPHGALLKGPGAGAAEAGGTRWSGGGEGPTSVPAAAREKPDGLPQGAEPQQARERSNKPAITEKPCILWLRLQIITGPRFVGFLWFFFSLLL